MSQNKGMTEDEVLGLPVSVPLVTAGRALGMGRTKAHELARRNEFPCRVLRLGGTYRVPKADLLRVLGLDPESRSQEMADIAS